ncbi:272_t:CDS:2 [Paraglomus occultum]|uniref:272_t:CDS:1 n=1 Tax=Paraglomus occultum TaxID=144539 RepID=A0A9N9FD82_9GLOM|nr:272_t:CDS:2 [Paraglomus occultum]
MKSFDGIWTGLNEKELLNVERPIFADVADGWQRRRRHSLHMTYLLFVGKVVSEFTEEACVKILRLVLSY